MSLHTVSKEAAPDIRHSDILQRRMVDFIANGLECIHKITQSIT